jgi:protein ImuB
MRIACVHVPQFALQCLGRVDPSLRGAAVAVVGAGYDPAAGVRPSLGLHSPIVLACSRAAWTLGVRLGMTASAARFVSPELRVVTADAQLERETVRAIADATLAASPVVDTGGRVAPGGAHLAMYCEVPGKTRGTVFGDRLLELLDTLGLAARVGIADDRFTAWVAAAHGAEGVPRDRTEVPRDGAGVVGAARTGGNRRADRGVVLVPRGGSAAFLAPRPLSLLAITPEVQHMLEALGVRTLGEFAALPAPSVSRPLEADYQALARGDSGSVLRPYAPEAPVREELVIGHPGGARRLFGGADAVAELAERVASRLRGRARSASRLEVTITGASGERVAAVGTAERPARSAAELTAWIAPLIAEAPGAQLRLRIVVVGEALAGAEAAAGEGTGEAVTPSGSAAVRSASASAGAAAVRGDAAAARSQDVDEHGADHHPVDGGHLLAGEHAGQTDLGELVSLAQPGQPWQVEAPAALRAAGREPHRRTRRARQRRRDEAVGQALLFGTVDRSDSRSG